MRIDLAYVFPAVQPEKYVPAARLFVSSYLDCPPGESDHDVHVIVTGGKPNPAVNRLFEPLPIQLHHADNYAKDLGAFKLAADKFDSDLLVCLGAHVNFRRGGWLDRIVQCLDRTGPTVCGPWGFLEPTPHLRTTFFCFPPALIRSYPHDLRDRYQFEHGRNNFSLWSRKLGFEPYQITWTGAYPLEGWHPTTLDESLARDNHTLRDFGE